MSTIRSFLAKPWLYLLIIVLGIVLKFYNLDSKLFWEDEVSTVLYTTGLKGQVIKNSIPPNQILHISYYDSLLHPRTKPYTFNNQVRGILSDTHLTPAHYVFLAAWYRIVGDSNTDYRLFSVFAFLLSLPFMFLLARTLFDSALAGWIATSLYAISPFIHFEAQEARYYSLWASSFIVANYLLLNALKQNNSWWWISYTLSCILALYISALSGLLIGSHLIYVLLYKKRQLNRFSLSLLFIVLAYLPWMYFLFTVQETIESGLAWHKFGPYSYYSLELLYFQLMGFTKSISYFLDGGTYNSILEAGVLPPDYLPFIIELIVLAFILYALFFLCTKTPKETRAFLLLILVPLVLFFYLSDVFRQAHSSRLWRYQIVNMIAITLIITNLLQVKIAKGKILFAGLYMGLVTIGFLSILKIAANRCWNTRPDCPSNIEEALHISQAPRPLLITDFSNWGFANFLAIINEAKTRNADIIYIKETIPDIKEKAAGKAYSDIYVMQASDELTQNLKNQFGDKMTSRRQQPNRMSPQIWHVKL